jgi:transposase
VINGVLHRVRTGVQWRDLPDRFGPWKTVHKRHLQWSADGTWERLLQQVLAVADAGGTVDWDVSVDSTVMRAHQHAAGARKAPPPAVSKGATATEHQIDPAWTGLATHLAEVVAQVRAWAARAAGSPPRST